MGEGTDIYTHRDTHTNAQTQINFLTWLGLGAGPSKKYGFKDCNNRGAFISKYIMLPEFGHHLCADDCYK